MKTRMNVHKNHLFILLFLFLLLGSSGQAISSADPKLFPRPAALEHDVLFWKRIFGEVDTKHGLIHDNKHLKVIYEEIRLPQGVSYKTRQKYIKKVKKRYTRILSKLSKGKRTGLTAEERRILALWPKNVSNRTLKSGIKNIRFQLGQSNKFIAGLKRSGAWRKFILNNLDKMGLPREIARLPHVESSFNPKAYSHVGAAGLWQFTRSTGRRFMRVDHIVDERMDPFAASVAAARLLENNYAVTGTWPLALTAYNHGAAGMRNAAKKMGTHDITTILRKYKSRSFKFASRNFYLAFLAVNDVEAEAEHYFGKVNYHPEISDQIVTLPAYMSASTVSKALGISKSDLKYKNPALRSAVWNGSKHIPRGYKLRIDPSMVSGSAYDKIAKAASKNSYAKQKPDRHHKVRRGQTLSSIAARYGVRVKEIVAVNSLRSRNRIRVGQVLRLPQNSKKSSKTLLASRSSMSRKKTKISIKTGPTKTYKVRKGDSLAKISKRTGVSQRTIMAANNLKNKNRIYPGQRLRLQVPSKKAVVVASAKTERASETYKVRKGDSLAKIAKRTGVTEKTLMQANRLKNKNRIYPGQILHLKLPTETQVMVASANTNPPTSTTENAHSNNKAGLNNKTTAIKVASLDIPASPIESESTITTITTTTSDAQTDLETTTSISVEDSFKVENPLIGITQAPTTENNDLHPQGELPVIPDLHETKSPSVDTKNAIARLTALLGLQAEQDELGSADKTTGFDIDTANALAVESKSPTVVATISKNSNIEDSIDHKNAEIENSLIEESEDTLALAADPSDYSVSKKNTIEVQAEETLGHYAEWLNLRASRLRRVNKMRYGKPVIVGKRLKLDFSKVTHEEFEQQRQAYHRAIQETFFEKYQISGSDKHKIRRGDSLWRLAKHKYKIPLWLLRQYNPDLMLSNIRPGTIVTFPKLIKREDITESDQDPSLSKKSKTAKIG